MPKLLKVLNTMQVRSESNGDRLTVYENLIIGAMGVIIIGLFIILFEGPAKLFALLFLFGVIVPVTVTLIRRFRALPKNFDTSTN